MRWRRSHRFDPRVLPLADRHYNRKKPGSPQFVPPGSCCVLAVGDSPDEADAVWATSAPFAKYVRHAWPGAWINSIFRNESEYLASELIVEAVAASRYLLGNPPELGMVTFVDAGKVKANRRPGRIYERAGFRKVGTTKGGLLAFQLLPEEMPPPEVPQPMFSAQLSLLDLTH